MRRRVLYFTEPRHIEIREEAIPSLGPRDLLVRSLRSALSAGTELLFYRGKLSEGHALDESLGSLANELRYPLSYGYACSGEVLEVGEDVAPSWVGRRVFAFQPHASYFVVREEDLFVLEDGLDDETATLWPTVETAVNFALDGRPRVGERVLVVGQGVVGLVTTFVLAQFPLEALWTVEPITSRRELSKRLGAGEALAPEELQAHDFDLVYEVSSSTAGLNVAIDATGFEGRLVIGSWYGDEPIEAKLGTHFHRGRLELRSSQVSHLAPELRARWTKSRRMETARRLLAELPSAELISHRFPFDRAAEAYAIVDESPDACTQVLLAYT